MSADEDVRSGEATDSVTFAFGDPVAERYGLARLGRGPDGTGSALCVLFAGREPVAAHARGGEPVGGDGSWRDTQVAALRATVDVPHARWTVSFDAEDGQGFALEFAALGEPVASDAGAGGMAGYEQPCQVTGTVRAGGSETEIAALGQRGRVAQDVVAPDAGTALEVPAEEGALEPQRTQIERRAAEHLARGATGP